MKKTLVMAAAAVLTGSMAYPSLAEEYVFEMAPVVVTANRMNENLVDARADISVVTSRQIEKLHLNTVEDALRTVPGTQYLNYGGNGLNANLSGIRINGSKDIILLVDGVRVTDFNGANNSGYMYSSLLNNMDNVERIEVLRGSAGALYGSGAKGGVINIITKNPGEKKTTVDIARGTGGREIYKLTTMGRVGKFSYMAYYDKLLIGDTKSGDGRLWPGHTHTLSDGVKFAYDFTDKHSLSLSYDKMKSRYRGYDFVYSNRYHGDYKSDMLTLQDKISIGKHWDNQFTYRRNKVKTNYFQDYDMNAQSNWGISSDYTYDIIGEQVSFHDEWNRLTFGVDYSKGRDNVLRAAGFDVNGNPVKTNHWYENYSFYIQEDWNFLPRWSLSGGLRHDRPETDQYTADFSSHTSKSYRLSYEITPKDTVYAGRNDFYILPGLDVLYIPQYGNAKVRPAYGYTDTIGSPAGIYAGSGKNVTITAGKVNVITAGLPGGNSITNAIWLDAPKTGSGRITIHAPVNIAMTGGLGGNGIAIQKTNRWGESSYEAAASSKIIINGNVNIKGADNTVWGIPVNYENVYSRFNNAGILASVNDSEVQVNGNINFDVYGNGITVNAAGSKVSVGGGQITVPSGMNYGYYTLGAYQGTINVNTGIGGNTPGTADVNLNGDIFVLPTGTVNAAFTTANSRLHGIVDNGGTVNMWLRNGATWTNEARNTHYGEDNEDTGSNGASRITHFYGGNTAAGAGIINQKSDKAITIDHYSGNTTVNFGTLTQNGNGVTISAAAANSGITMSGDRGGLSETEAMGRLAGKLTYTAYVNGERNLNGTVKLNEGLTARSVARTGRINFNSATGKGSLGELFRGSLIMKMMAAPSASVTSGVSAADGMTLAALPGGGEALYSSGMAYILGDRETMMMRGAKSAMTTSMLSWRSGMTDMNQRLGDLRLGASSGMWARTYGGKVKYDKDKTNLSDSFWGAQVGADHKLASGWHIGGAFDYNDGNAKYDFGGKGDPKLYVGSVYGTKVFDDGQYVDIVGKIGRAENDYTVYNAEGRKLDGDYHATGYGLSMEYGKRFGTAAGYVEPQIQLLFSRLGSADYDAASDFDGDKKMHVHQDSMSSFIGRLGIAAGRATEKGNLYAKASILHEFKGDTAATFSAEGEDTSRVEQDFGDTWAELTLGGVYRLNGSNLFYANVTRGFGGDYKMEWKVNAGLRFAF